MFHEICYGTTFDKAFFKNACLQGCLFSQKLNKHTLLEVKWRSNKNLKAIEIVFLVNIYNDRF